MSSANQSGKTQKDRLVELEEQMLYLTEVLDSIRFLESRLEEIAEKTDTIDAQSQAPAGGAIPFSRVKIPKPKLLCGARDAKALENYIFDLEQYFRATNTVTEEAKVTPTTMHLSEDAKLWWRSRYVDMQEGRCTIDT
ncbi:uncharacterized protein E5676_scaffold3369G00010 [Cucumis melo var. makuwa]|uniref:Senescence-specific cysteine protease sag39 n=1 Tax=Cucumis melo var. makuwa TaxID=1194695 RepID=A0A5A7U365_CUCMM|nr:uncharacterized protein E6C27_scaffold88G00010 [Cucumis melo var. makuwa]TYK14755.1 uncharacterized protein E5676_scaffold3369G00010 [Cucumis melo var. makuwa]